MIACDVLGSLEVKAAFWYFYIIKSVEVFPYFSSVCLSPRSRWCCSFSTHSTPFATSSSLPLTTWSRSAQANSSPIWTETSCTLLSSSEWTTVQPDWAATSANDRVTSSLPSVILPVLRWDDALWWYHPCLWDCIGNFPAHTVLGLL